MIVSVVMTPEESKDFKRVTDTKNLPYNGYFMIYTLKANGNRDKGVRVKGKVRAYIAFNAILGLHGNAEIIQEH